VLENLGEVACPFHDDGVMANVRRNKNGRLFFSCPECGPVQVHGGQAVVEWILNNATMYGAKVKDDAQRPTNPRRESRLQGEDGRRQGREESRAAGRLASGG
jgi:hypothetical protein